MKVALVHDWLIGLRGGERCLEAFLRIYPNADIFALLHVPGSTTPEIDARVKGTSYLQRLPGIRKYYRLLLPLFPSAARSIKLNGYDLVISLSHCAAKNVVVPSGTKHICYCFTPMRYVWDQARSYFGILTPLLYPLIRSLRAWDVKGSKGPDIFVAISKFVAARIRLYYGRQSSVIYPPVDTSWILPADKGSAGKAFLLAGALVPYKRPDLVIKAFNELGEPLWVVGKGPLYRSLKRIAKSNINFVGHVSDFELARFYRESRALIFPGVEDFGMVPVECMAAGRPVIGVYDGALKETVRGVRHWNLKKKQTSEGRASLNLDNRFASGVFIETMLGKNDRDQVQSLVNGVRYFIDNEAEFHTDNCSARAEHFSPMRFYRAWHNLLMRHGMVPSISVDPASDSSIDQPGGDSSKWPARWPRLKSAVM